MDVSIVFARLASLAIHLLSVATSTNVWTIFAERIRFVLTLPEATFVHVNVDSSEIHTKCVHQFKRMPNVMIQIIVCAAKPLLARLDIDATVVIV